jgi:hypothetical protein
MGRAIPASRKGGHIKMSEIFREIIFYVILVFAIWCALSFIGSAARTADPKNCEKEFYLDRVVFTKWFCEIDRK